MLGASYEALLKAALNDGFALKGPEAEGDGSVSVVGTGTGTEGALNDLIENLKKKAGF